MSAKLVWALVFLAGAVAAAEALGLQASIEEFPSLTQVEFRVDTVWVQKCAATVLTSYHVLSTASCFSGPTYTPEYRRIRAGSSTRGDGAIIEVLYATMHDSTNLIPNDGDIAVVRLAQGLTLGDNIQQAAILGQSIELPGGLRVELAGWGTTAEGGDISNDDLYTTGLIVNNHEGCMGQYQLAADPEIITENMLCVGLAYTRGRDFDPADAGAPLFYQDTLVGLLSFGREADDEYPVVATAISSYTDWIIEIATA